MAAPMDPSYRPRVKRPRVGRGGGEGGRRSGSRLKAVCEVVGGFLGNLGFRLDALQLFNGADSVEIKPNCLHEVKSALAAYGLQHEDKQYHVAFILGPKGSVTLTGTSSFGYQDPGHNQLPADFDAKADGRLAAFLHPPLSNLTSLIATVLDFEHPGTSSSSVSSQGNEQREDEKKKKLGRLNELAEIAKLSDKLRHTDTDSGTCFNEMESERANSPSRPLEKGPLEMPLPMTSGELLDVTNGDVVSGEDADKKFRKILKSHGVSNLAQALRLLIQRNIPLQIENGPRYLIYTKEDPKKVWGRGVQEVKFTPRTEGIKSPNKQGSDRRNTRGGKKDFTPPQAYHPAPVVNALTYKALRQEFYPAGGSSRSLLPTRTPPSTSLPSSSMSTATPKSTPALKPRIGQKQAVGEVAGSFVGHAVLGTRLDAINVVHEPSGACFFEPSDVSETKEALKVCGLDMGSGEPPLVRFYLTAMGEVKVHTAERSRGWTTNEEEDSVSYEGEKADAILASLLHTNVRNITAFLALIVVFFKEKSPAPVDQYAVKHVSDCLPVLGIDGCFDDPETGKYMDVEEADERLRYIFKSLFGYQSLTILVEAYITWYVPQRAKIGESYTIRPVLDGVDDSDPTLVLTQDPANS